MLLPVERPRAPRRSRYLSWFVVAALMPVLAHPEPSVSSAVPSISAEHVRRHVPSDTEIVRRQVELSPAGLRVRERVDGAELEVIQDFEQERLWFVDRQRGVFNEVPLDGFASESAIAPDISGLRAARANVANDDESTSIPDGDHADPASGLLAVEPCAGRVTRTERSGTWRGRRVMAYRCLDPAGNVLVTELVDTEFGIVVHQRSRAGYVDELHGLRARTFVSGHFSPSVQMRSVDASELIVGAPPVAAFVEADGPLPSPPLERRAGDDARQRSGPRDDRSVGPTPVR